MRQPSASPGACSRTKGTPRLDDRLNYGARLVLSRDASRRRNSPCCMASAVYSGGRRAHASGEPGRMIRPCWHLALSQPRCSADKVTTMRKTESRADLLERLHRQAQTRRQFVGWGAGELGRVLHEHRNGPAAAFDLNGLELQARSVHAAVSAAAAIPRQGQTGHLPAHGRRSQPT